jgi:hypothetical protein
MGQSIDECELLTGTRSAEGIMASGPVSRTNRPNRWLLRPALQRTQSLDSLEPSTDRERFLQDLNLIVKALGKLQANGVGKAE